MYEFSYFDYCELGKCFYSKKEIAALYQITQTRLSELAKEHGYKFTRREGVVGMTKTNVKALHQELYHAERPSSWQSSDWRLDTAP